LLYLSEMAWVVALRDNAILIRMFGEIQNISSLAVVGLAKNVGKTVTLNWLIDNLHESRRLAVTSIGLDGEGLDQVTKTEKPEITLHENMLFTTAEGQYRGRQLCSEILGIGDMTACGRLVTARVREKGKVIITGPATTAGIARLLKEYKDRNIDLALVDGALSRLSLASPAITDGLVLATGAAVAVSMNELVQKTKYVCQLIELPEYDSVDENRITVQSGLGGEIPQMSDDINTIEVRGAVGNRFVERLRMQNRPIALVVNDFTKIFVTQDCYAQMLRSKVKFFVKYKSRLMGITVNPWSPTGYTLNSNELCSRLMAATGREVINVRE